MRRVFWLIIVVAALSSAPLFAKNDVEVGSVLEVVKSYPAVPNKGHPFMMPPGTTYEIVHFDGSRFKVKILSSRKQGLVGKELWVEKSFAFREDATQIEKKPEVKAAQIASDIVSDDVRAAPSCVHDEVSRPIASRTKKNILDSLPGFSASEKDTIRWYCDNGGVYCKEIQERADEHAGKVREHGDNCLQCKDRNCVVWQSQRLVEIPPGSPWCMAYVQKCVMSSAAYAEEVTPDIELSGHCVTVWNQSDAENTLEISKVLQMTPEQRKKVLPGTIVIWKQSGKTTGHTGLVLEVSADGKKIKTLEGNTSSGSIHSQRDGGGVFERWRPIDQLGPSFPALGYIIPIRAEPK